MSVCASGDEVGSQVVAFHCGVSRVANRKKIAGRLWFRNGTEGNRETISGYYRCQHVVSYRGHYSLDGGCRQLLSFGLLHHCDTQVFELKRHALQKGLPGVRPVLWEFWKWENTPVMLLIANKGEWLIILRDTFIRIKSLYLLGGTLTFPTRYLIKDLILCKSNCTIF